MVKFPSMATKAEGINPEIICEKCKKRRAQKECLLLGTEIVYLCQECAEMIKPLMPFLGKKEEEH